MHRVLYEWFASFIVILAVTVPSHQTRDWVSINTTGVGSFTLANEYGIVVTNRNYVVFNVKACSNAVIVVSDVASIANTKGHYFLVMIGNKGNTETQVMDSCFTCSRTKIVKGPLLDCNVFKHFWLQWDGEGLCRLGKGPVVGREMYLELQGQMGTYKANFIQVTSTQRINALFRFSVDTVPALSSPLPNGTTIISVKETQALNTSLLEVKLDPITPDVVIEAFGKGSDDFYIDNRTLRIRKRLDFETRQYYTLAIGSPEGFAVAMLVNVLDENDETPSLTVFPGNIPEEIQVGTVIGGLYSATDRDRGDNLTLSLSGTGSDIFEALGKGQLLVIKRIDRDGAGGIRYLDKLKLTATDLAGHTSSIFLNVTILDINDNAPVCDPAVHNQEIDEASTKDVPIVHLRMICSDRDVGDNGNLTYKILGEKWVTSSFSINDGELVARAGALDRENSTQRGVIYFVVQVEDNAKQGAKRRSYIQVTIKVLPVNEFAPEWRSLKPGTTDELNPIIVASGTPVGRVISTVAATDEDKGDKPLVYSITSITTNAGVDGSDLLHINSATGYISVSGPLTDVTSLLVQVKVTDGDHTISAHLSVSVVAVTTSESSAPSHKSKLPPVVHKTKPLPVTKKPHPVTVTTTPSPPIPISESHVFSYFNKRLYYMRMPKFDQTGSVILNFTVQGLSTSQTVVVELSAGKYFTVRKTGHEWQLVFIKKPYSRKAIPTVILLLVNDRVTKKTVDEAYVVFKPENCDVVPHLHTPTHKPEVHYKEKKPNVMKNQKVFPTQSNTGGCGGWMSHTTQILTAVAAVQGLALGAALAFFAYKKFKSGKMMPSVAPERREPLGCDEVFQCKDFPNKSSNIPKEFRRDGGLGTNRKEKEKQQTDPSCDTLINVDEEPDKKYKNQHQEMHDESEGGKNEKELCDQKDKTWSDPDNDPVKDSLEPVRERVAEDGPVSEVANNEEDEDKMKNEGDKNPKEETEIRKEPSGLSVEPREQLVGEEDEDIGDRFDDRSVDKENGNIEKVAEVEGPNNTMFEEDLVLTADNMRGTLREELSLVSLPQGDTSYFFDSQDPPNTDNTQNQGHPADDTLMGHLNDEGVDDELKQDPLEEGLTVPDKSVASSGEEETEDDAEEEEEIEEEMSDIQEEEGDADNGTEVAAAVGGVAGAAVVGGAAVTTVRKRRIKKKVKKEKKEKKKKPKLRKIDFTQSPYNFPAKETTK